MNAQERSAALRNLYTLSGYYNSISGVLGIDQCRDIVVGIVENSIK